MNYFDIPITDTHVHVIGDTTRYPMVSPRSYTPEAASSKQLEKMLERTGIARAVIVQLSSYGPDNTCMLDAMSELGNEVRGVVHTNADTTEVELDDMHSKGVRGIRINLNSTGANEPDKARAKLQQASRHCVRNGWHIQMFTTPEIVAELTCEIADCPVPVVLDHFGLISSIDHHRDGELAIRRLLSKGKLWIKLSGTYRLFNTDAGALARALYSDNPDQLVWGSDWPHTPSHDGVLKINPVPTPNRDIDAADLLADCRDWFNDDQAMKRILWKNPEKIYGFG